MEIRPLSEDDQCGDGFVLKDSKCTPAKTAIPQWCEGHSKIKNVENTEKIETCERVIDMDLNYINRLKSIVGTAAEEAYKPKENIQALFEEGEPEAYYDELKSRMDA